METENPKLKTQNFHLVILKKPYLDAIVAGRKTIESRFTRTRHQFFGQVRAGDKLFLKVSSGPVCAVATVVAVKYFENLTPQQMGDIKRRYNHYIRADEQYWQSKADCRFGFLAWLENIEPIEPRLISKKDWRAWVVLTAKENFGLPLPPDPCRGQALPISFDFAQDRGGRGKAARP